MAWQLPSRKPFFGKAAGRTFNLEHVVEVDFTQIEQLRAIVYLLNGSVIEALDIEALELAYQVKPSVIEGKRMKHHRHTWAVHNIIGHPLMQLLAFFKLYRWAFIVHDRTAPKALR